MSSSTIDPSKQIPAQKMIEDLAGHLAGVAGGVEAELRRLQSQLANYKGAQSRLLERQGAFQAKLPGAQKALDAVRLLQDTPVSADEPMLVDYQLADHVYAKAQITEVNMVSIWLGASVMVEYTIEEALELLKGNVDEIMGELERIRVFLDYVQDQITTTEVMMARFYNHDVKTKRAAAGK